MNPNTPNIMTILYVGELAEDFIRCAKENEILFIEVGNGLEATNVLKDRTDIDIIISHYNLPGNNGLYLYDRIPELSLSQDVPFILLSDEYSKRLFTESFKKGISDYFVLASTKADHIIAKAQSLHNFHLKNFNSGQTYRTTTRYKIPVSKRVFDIIFASLILLFISPFLLMVILAIWLESRGKVYYIAKRVGRKTFDFYKLRSMKTGSDKLISKLAQENNQYNSKASLHPENLEENCPRCSKLPIGKTCSPILYKGVDVICDYWYNFLKKEKKRNSSTFIKIVDDPRITRIGKFIRNTSIDELPQLINVIKGDMSIVGNRPLPLYEAELLTEDVRSKRFLAPAGITGLWQVELRGKGGKMSERERMELDNKYAEYFTGNKYSFWNDMKIIMRTIPALMQKSTV